MNTVLVTASNRQQDSISCVYNSLVVCYSGGHVDGFPFHYSGIQDPPTLWLSYPQGPGCSADRQEEKEHKIAASSEFLGLEIKRYKRTSLMGTSYIPLTQYRGARKCHLWLGCYHLFVKTCSVLFKRKQEFGWKVTNACRMWRNHFGKHDSMPKFNLTEQVHIQICIPWEFSHRLRDG